MPVHIRLSLHSFITRTLFRYPFTHKFDLRLGRSSVCVPSARTRAFQVTYPHSFRFWSHLYFKYLKSRDCYSTLKVGSSQTHRRPELSKLRILWFCPQVGCRGISISIWYWNWPYILCRRSQRSLFASLEVQTKVSHKDKLNIEVRSPHLDALFSIL